MKWNTNFVQVQLLGARNLLLPEIGAVPDAYCNIRYGGARHVTQVSMSLGFWAGA